LFSRNCARERVHQGWHPRFFARRGTIISIGG
jgi:hypothetical protein